MINYQGKWILITGASSGLGLTYAKEFASRGANLILASRSETRLNEIAHELRQKFKIEIDAIKTDLAQLEAGEQLYREIEKRGRDVFGVVNNAGVGVFGKLGESSLKENQQEILLNVFAVSTLSQLYIGAMAKKREGFIVNVASVAAYGPAPYMANYAASKSFVLSFTTALWAEYRDSGVRVLAVCPGVTDTAFFDVVGAKTVAGSNWKKDSPSDVVSETFRALGTQQAVVIAGSFRNRFLAVVSGFIPGAWIARVVTHLHKPE